MKLTAKQVEDITNILEKLKVGRERQRLALEVALARHSDESVTIGRVRHDRVLLRVFGTYPCPVDAIPLTGWISLPSLYVHLQEDGTLNLGGAHAHKTIDAVKMLAFTATKLDDAAVLSVPDLVRHGLGQTDRAIAILEQRLAENA